MPGSLELENWVTWRHATGPGRFDQVDFRYELKYGVTDKLQASIYLADWFYKSDPQQSKESNGGNNQKAGDESRK